MNERALHANLRSELTIQNQLLELRPRLRNEVLILPIKDGAYLRSDNHAAVINIENAWELMSVLSQYLTGDWTVAEIYRMFQDGMAEEIPRLVRFLFQNGFATHTTDDARAEVLEAVGNKFETQIKFLGHCTPRPWAAFRDFRRARLLLVGSGVSFRTCAIALLRSGLERLYVLPLAFHRGETDLQGVNDVADSIHALGVRSHVSIVTPERESLEQCDLIAYCTDLPYLHDLHAFERRSARLGRPFYPGIIVGNCGFMGPITKPDSAGCRVCCVLRLAPDFIEETLCYSFWRSRRQSNSPLGMEFTPCTRVAKMIGAEVAFELFKALAGDIRPEMRSCVQVYRADEQEAVRVDLVPHPPDACIGMCKSFEERQLEYRTAAKGRD